MTTTHDRAAWLQARRSGVGGSDVAAIFNEEFGCARALWYDKTGTDPDFPRETTGPMRLGIALEPLACELYAEQTGRSLRTAPAAVHPDYPHMRCNVDRIIDPVEGLDGPGVLEVKTTNAYVFRYLRREGLRNAYILQLNHNIAVTGLRWGAFAVMERDSGSLIHFDVRRDDALIAVLLDAEARFWRSVESGPAPDPLPEIDKRCRTCPWRTRCRGAEIMAMHPGQPGESDLPLEQDDGLDPLLVDYAEAQRMADEAEETVELIRQAIKARMGDRRAAECHAGRVYYAPQTSQRIDTKLLRAKYPDVAKECSKPSVSRPLKIIPA